MAHRIPDAVAFDSEIFDSMESRTTIVAAHDGVVFHVRFCHTTDHMVMDRIFSEQEGLANVFELKVLDPADDFLVTRGVDHDMSTKLIGS